MAQQSLSFREKVIEGFLQLTSPARAGAVSVYSALTVALYTQLASVYQAVGPEAVGALGISLGTGVFTNLLASRIYDALKPDDTAALVAKIEELHADESLHQEVEQHLHALQITQQVLLQAVLSQRLSESDHERIAATIRAELVHLDRPPWPDPHQEALREAYLNHLYEEAGEISFVGVDPQAAAEANTPAARAALGEIYVPLWTAEAEPELMTDKGNSARLRRSEMEVLRTESRRLSAITQLDRHARLVLLGDPGSGKTTFARFAAQCLAGEALGRDMNLARLTTSVPGEQGQKKPDSWSHGARLPVMVELRRLAAVALPAVGETARAIHLSRFLNSELVENGLQEFAAQLERLLRYPGGLVVFDGLDEVSEAEQRRAQILQMIEDFAALYPNCRLLVTSRTYSYRHQGWRLKDFHEADLRPFDPAQIEVFIDRWYRHTVVVRRRKEEDAQGRASRLKEAVRDSPRLAELAARPLLLTLMAALHDWREGNLPEQRWELYENAVDLLLERWNQGKMQRDSQGREIGRLPNLAEWLKVDRRQVRALLQELAYKAHKAQSALRGTADIPEAELVKGLYELTKAPQVHPNDIIGFLQDRAGLLIAHGDKVYTFPHRTLQEYLAACHLTDLDYPDELAELTRNEPDRWREVALLAGGKAANGAEATIWALADALCPEECPAHEQPRGEAWGALIAGIGLLESANLDRMTPRKGNTITRLRGHWVRILQEGKLPAIERAYAGRVLGQLGDRRPGVGIVEATGLPDIAWCLIPAGSFTMGSHAEERGAFDDERPQHVCEIPYDYSISRYPITVAQYQAFVKAGGYAEERWWTRSGWEWRCASNRVGQESFRFPFSLPNHPMVVVRWHEAMAFTRWLTAQPQAREGWVVDLPSEAEWEKAARGSEDARPYPWGGVLEPDRASYFGTGIGSTSAVGCFPGGVSPYGVEECIGSVFEWTRSRYIGYLYPYRAADDCENPEGKAARALRGGSWLDPYPRYLRVASRIGLGPTERFIDLGFRCVLRPPGL